MLALPLLIGLSACSDDDQPKQEVSNNAVRFNVTVPRASKAATTTASIDHFRIFSFVNSNPYMSNVVAKRTNSAWTTTPVMYWPADDAPVNFYCISPMVGEPEGTQVPNPNIGDYENTDGRTDLLYSVTTGATVNPVGLNFRHALSKVAFNFKRKTASDQQAPLKVDVKEVVVTAINGTASFTFPDKTTSPDAEASGTWHDYKSLGDVTVFSGSTATLSDTYEALNSTGYEFAIPQVLPESKSDLSGAYVKVLCSIYDETSGVKIWPKGADDAYLYFPLSSPGASNTTSTWKIGKAYAYNITIGVPVGSGKIDFDVTVDEYPSFEDMYLE